MTDDDDAVHLSDLVDDRSDLRTLSDVYKDIAEQRRDNGEDVGVDDVLPLTSKNDPAYIRPSDIEKAEWFAEIYRAEGEPEIHPRGFHYRILDQDYTRRNGEAYQNTQKCWNELKEGAKWAQILGLVDPERILDQKNQTPRPTAFSDPENPAQDRDRPVGLGDEDAEAGPPRAEGGGHADDDDDFPYDTGFEAADIDTDIDFAKFEHDGVEDLVRSVTVAIVEEAFDDIYYDPHARQDYYIEIWAEKAGVIPEELAADYGATIRPAGGGEMSYSMCQNAVSIAKEREQALAVAVISDFDPKGHDMKLSCSRKIQLEATLEGIEAEVVHAAVTKAQVLQHAIPGTPASKPRGLEYGNPGAKGYETHKELFREYAGQEPVEIQAFQSRYPSAFRQAVEDVISPYYDTELAEKIKDGLGDAKQEAYTAIGTAFLEEQASIAEAINALEDSLDGYQEDVEPGVEAVRSALEELEEHEAEAREEHSVDDRVDALESALDESGWDDAVENLDVDLPSPEIDHDLEPVLDTRRPLIEQLKAFDRADIRS